MSIFRWPTRAWADADPTEARIGHVLYWLCFGAAAAGVWCSFLIGPSLIAVLGIMAFAFLGVMCLGGLYRTWDLMTENE